MSQAPQLTPQQAAAAVQAHLAAHSAGASDSQHGGGGAGLSANAASGSGASTSRSPSSAAHSSSHHASASQSGTVGTGTIGSSYGPYGTYSSGHGFGPGGSVIRNAAFNGLVQGGTAVPGGSASLPTDSHDVASGGVGRDYGPYSHVRGASVGGGAGAGAGSGSGGSSANGGAFARGRAGPRAFPHHNATNSYSQTQSQATGGMFSTQSSGSGNSAASSHHSGQGLLPGQAPAGAGAAGAASGAGGPRFRGAAAYSYASSSQGSLSDMNKRDSTFSTASSNYALPAQAPASGALLWDSRDAEPDDYLHNPDPKRDAKQDRHCTVFSMRGILNVAALTILCVGLLTLFAGYPIISHYLHRGAGTLGGFGLGGTNGTGQVAQIPGLISLIDKDTPNNVKTWKSMTTGDTLNLVFSDEFDVEGRTFWPGDDPFWEAVNIWYGATGDYEWYSPEAINTTNGALMIVMSAQATHNLNFQSGMLQSWNKFCFQGGYIEMAVQLPGTQETRGFWPGLWTMGNLGRPGYLGSTEGMWPYSYDACDYGTLPNQTNPQGTGPPQVLNANGPYSAQYDGKLSYLPGQRASACTCPGEDHPGPNVKVGRAAPEIDILEAQNAAGVGEASQSLQTAPFDPDYSWDNTSATFYNGATANSYRGAVFQEAVSGVSPIPSYSYIGAPGARFVKYGFEYQPDWNGDGSGYITWYIDGKRAWSVTSGAVPARPSIDISQRLIPVEPMSIIINLGISSGFQTVHWDELTFPATMLVDYVRVYQSGEPKTSCDPPDHPTADYINRHLDVYYNNNYTVFPREKYGWPKNSLLQQC